MSRRRDSAIALILSRNGVSATENLDGCQDPLAIAGFIDGVAEAALQIAHSFAQADELFGGEFRVSHVKFACRYHGAQKLREGLLHPVRAGREESGSDLRLILCFGRNPPFELHHFGPREKSDHRFADRRQALPQTAWRKVLDREMATHRFTLRLDSGGEESALVAEIIVNRHLGHACVSGDLFDRAGGETVCEKGSRGRGDDGFPLSGVGWAASFSLQLY